MKKLSSKGYFDIMFAPGNNTGRSGPRICYHHKRLKEVVLSVFKSKHDIYRITFWCF